MRYPTTRGFTMKIFKAAVPVEGETSIFQMDVIEHEGKFWLVPYWLNNPATGRSKPLRLIALETIQHQRVDSAPFGDFAVNVPIPKAVIDGRVQQQQGFGLNNYIVVEAPDIVFDQRAPTTP